VRFDNGVVGSITTSWAYQAPTSAERFSVAGERGSLHSDGARLAYRLRGQDEVTLDFEPVHEFAAEVEHFARAILERRRPLHTHVEGTQVLGMILAAYESARTKTIAPVQAADQPVTV
jgi:predicted dehydrogenase